MATAVESAFRRDSTWLPRYSGGSHVCLLARADSARLMAFADSAASCLHQLESGCRRGHCRILFHLTPLGDEVEQNGGRIVLSARFPTPYSRLLIPDFLGYYVERLRR